MNIIVIGIIVYAIIKIVQKDQERREAMRAERERQRIREEQERQRVEIRRQMEAAKEQTRRQIELEREQIRQRREQDRQRDEQTRQAKEQERQRREQERQAEQLMNLEFRISQAEADIEAGEERIASLYALMDLCAARQAQTIPGSREDEAEQRKIISLENQIRVAQRRVTKARYDREAAMRKLSA